MGLEDLDETLVLGAILLQPLELVTAGPESTGGRMPQGSDRRIGFLAGIYQILGQGADDAVTAGIDSADAIPVLSGGFNQSAGAGIDHRGDAAGLGIKGILAVTHGSPRGSATRRGVSASGYKDYGVFLVLNWR
jgi:hypothetical protein